ncbi:alpha/beta fold hydrolase [Burkholderia pseudomultivorans]|uniref:Poly(3-hydroxyalkanoate) polymerase subunit PhaC n=1 Tax=Burkholderia pseudomultivorans TaxID=1207504 RepID=A0ABU2DYI9_9BURK|nr:alpha/beta fold hydrolase [Burkholderia pseudomultivorans]MDR8726238.1 Poly(3-hydroxyalkanoate) polymerase subunit PhaC [Burkholderia pseudomultivorans]MDR8732922.1 Poly(3-hydroxyalkanoate) polymerase subunit PhaC [Burkholderia pseudomultivorans]MDR8739788.1 Poly(3-hydroxyalkanoate) polymerase subunit PhaC [Burkholderia pseudomultivorans]MDR8752494.1 Poly(3-hydroxyalkanoate) polymerase subunit PhaC [Burkholderia pseudomultivorans]MDR8775894.1 Poly(3-hydroxyalkanoate) polymerase subunit PhaC
MKKTDDLAARPDRVPALPMFWPMAAMTMLQAGSEIAARNLRFLAEEEKLHFELHPALASPNRPLLELRTMTFRDYSVEPGQGLPTIVDAPYAGHSAMIADFQPGQSLMETLRGNGVTRLYLTDWRSATDDMKDLEIDQYLAELNVCIDELGGRVNLVGLCQGGWMSAMYAARFPHKVASLVLAGAPIDADAGDSPIKRMAHAYPVSFYEELVAMGGGLMRGRLMLRGWKNMHPDQHYLSEHVDLYEHLDDPDYLRKREAFASWYESPIDLPGRWYLQAIVQIFKENRLAKGTFVALGRTLDLKNVRCPVYLLAGEADDITTPEQVFNARDRIGTPAAQVTSRLVPGGHIGLFMGSRTLKAAWPEIARWIAAQR